MKEQERIDELHAALAAGSLDESGRAELAGLLESSPEALDHYLDHCEMETWLAAGGGSLSSPDFTAFPESAATVSRSRSGAWCSAAAGIAAAVILAWVFLPRDKQAEKSETPVIAEEKSAVAESVEPMLVADAPAARDPWKVINSTGSVKHPGLVEAAVPKTRKADRPVKFNRDIRPILSETCFHCHGPDEHGRRADLRLDSLAGATEDLGGSVAIAPGDLKKSEAWWRIISDDPDELMPPPESHLVLTQPQKDMIKRWIEQGAEYEGHWAFAAPIKATVPASKTEWGNNDVDRFVLARLEEEGLSPSAEAKANTLIRRLTFDLTGLPPTIEEVVDFESDYAERGEAAWQDAITRLLASPHFGERMATPWMDQARYADTNGYSIDGGRHMWLWRDWVIQAYNENKPFDEFVIEQIAGDLLPEATEAQRVATGFNRNHMITHEGGTIPDENLMNYVADRVKTTSEVFLGLTMACAQCHDHKYDPISAKDYYQFYSFFNELSDKGNDGNAGRNAVPNMMAKTVTPTTEVAGLAEDLKAASKAFNATEEGFDQWLTEMQAKERLRGKEFQTHVMELLDVSSPNRPGPYEGREDGSIFASAPSKGLNAFSHAFRVPGDQPVNGIRVQFMPHEAEGSDEALLTPHPDGIPKVSAILVSAGEQPAKQVDIYRQLELIQATASSSFLDPKGVLDERNLHWWQPEKKPGKQHLTITFSEPVDPAKTPYLSVMIFFGQSNSMPYHWRIDAFSGNDTESVLPEEVAGLIAKDAATWTKVERDTVLAAFRHNAPSLEATRVHLANLQERIDILTQPFSTMVMDVAPKPRETFILDRGQYDVKMEKVSSNTPAVLPPLKSEGKADRLDLAKWMVDPSNPLTARVAVNRLWATLFGTGIVATSADFGSQGEWPSHPDLIDWLAVDFVESGWDQKALIRKLVSSASYRQDSSSSDEIRELDPKNRLLARGPRFRLGAEFVRDQALAFSDLLVPWVGGPSVQPYQPAGLWKEVSHFGSSPATKQVFVQDKGEKLYRRSLYTITKRTSPSPGMASFDAPNREMCIVQRGVTNTPLQALVTLNDPQFAEASRVYAAKLIRATGGVDERERLTSAFHEITSRAPLDSELNALGSFLTDERARYEADRDAASRLVAVGDSPPDTEIDPVEQAIWTQVSALLFNLSETLTRL